ncbi:MAG: 2-hydroxyacyl-CoA dehydratase [Opitutaceae bacterium]|nr:2-hydroxyacyl-CoA dehydratase [Opitutaceae bacterium]
MTWSLSSIRGAGAPARRFPGVWVGLDLGSRASKGVLLTGDTIHTALIPTGLYMQETADDLLGRLLQESSLRRVDVNGIVATGYGRIALKFSDVPFQVVTEITCHAMGAHVVRPGTRTIIDIGGQDSKAIKVDPATGRVLDFVMNDKCAAGTGRFLEKAAALLGMQLDELGHTALRSKQPAQISSQCVVFAESEMVSLRARGEHDGDAGTAPNIAAGVHYSAARRVRNLLGRVGVDPELVFTGGVSNNPGMRFALEELIGTPFSVVRFDLIFAGALGAAAHAAAAAPATIHGRRQASTPAAAAVAMVQARIEATETAFAARADTDKRVGYLCAYTPIELVAASGARHTRLFKAGSPDTVARGELYTQSVFCDFSKSCLGSFAAGEPVSRALDHVYNFHTCASMKRVTEVIGEFVPTTMLNLPKLRDQATSRQLFRGEIAGLRTDLERLTGQPIVDAEIRRQIGLYNEAKSLLRRISELRKRQHSPLSGRDFLELARAYYHLPAEELIATYTRTLRDLSIATAADNHPVPPRLMISGSIMAEGDRRLIDLIEDELGARVVVEDHCAGLKPFYHSVANTHDPIQALADSYLDQAPCARMKPIESSIEFSTKLAREYAVDGVLYVYLKFCACYGVSKGAFLGTFERAGLPVLDISSDCSRSDHGQLKTRIEAFLELLRSRTACPPNHSCPHAASDNT